MSTPRVVFTQDMYERILVPTDGSTGVERAIQHAIDLATLHDAELHGVHAVNSASYGGLPMETSWDGVRDVLFDEGTAALDRVEELATRAGLDPVTALLEGSPSRCIVDYAATENCDLIVMGTHGRGGIDRLLLGSVAERVVRNADAAVLTVSVSDSASVEADERRQHPDADEDAATPTASTSGDPVD